MTSNIGSQFLLENPEDENSKKLVMESLKNKFKPEFLNRVDDIIMFKPLSEYGIKKIIDIFVDEVRERLIDRNITLKVTEEAKTLLAREGYDPIYGARPLKRYIQNTIENNLARKLIKGDIGYGDTAVVDAQNDELVIYSE